MRLGNLSGISSLEKTDSSSLRSHYLPVALHCRMGLVEIFPSHCHVNWCYHHVCLVWAAILLYVPCHIQKTLISQGALLLWLLRVFLPPFPLSLRYRSRVADASADAGHPAVTCWLSFDQL